MSWAQMRFRGQMVWVRVDAGGKPALDRDGRAEMKYRQEDARSYRPSPGNLEAVDGAARSEEAAPPPAAPSRKPRRAAPAGGPTAAGGTEVVHVWTDGACTGNPGPMGIGVVVIADGKRRELGEYLGQGTNNIAELTAIDRGLGVAETVTPGRDRPVRVYTDSAYAIGVISLGWKAKANQELVSRLRRKVGQFSEVVFVKVAGHAGVPENERCDELARHAIERRAGT
jgi:ribonuclease HI